MAGLSSTSSSVPFVPVHGSQPKVGQDLCPSPSAFYGSWCHQMVGWNRPFVVSQWNKKLWELPRGLGATHFSPLFFQSWPRMLPHHQFLEVVAGPHGYLIARSNRHLLQFPRETLHQFLQGSLLCLNGFLLGCKLAGQKISIFLLRCNCLRLLMASLCLYTH